MTTPTADQLPVFPELTNVEALGLVEKNSCGRFTYIVAIHVDLSAATDADFEKGIQVSVALKLEKYTGSREALIKRSDGGVYPKAWIILMRPVIAERETINVLHWKGKSLSRRTKLVRGDYAAGFKRMPISGLLKGGTATFQISSTNMWGVATYGHCFTLRPERQERGGYHH